MRIPVRVLPLALATALAVAGCSSGDGTTLRSPEPGATAPVRTTTTTVAPALINNDTIVPTFTLTSPAFQPNTEIPERFTCTGESISPSLVWSTVPSGAVEIVVLMIDQTADGAVHWLIAGIPPETTALGENAVPAGVEARNREGGLGWTAFCPPAGETHTYEITVFALAEPSGIAAGTDGAEAVKSLGEKVGWRAVLTGTATGG